MLEGRDILLGLSVIKKGDSREILYTLRNPKASFNSEEILEAKAKIKSDVMTYLDPDYPGLLKGRQMLSPPLVLYCKGNIDLLRNLSYYNVIGIVGSRESTLYGENAVRTIVKGLPTNTVIVSGLAKGIDRVAHQSALDNGLKTIAVLGSGLDYVYPAENRELYNRIINEGGLIISEYPGSLEPQQRNFGWRNRIIAGLSQFILVAEAYERSGTSITVNYALQVGAGVGCIPYPIEKNSLCNQLIKEGAYLVESAEDLIEFAEMKGDLWLTE